MADGTARIWPVVLKKEYHIVCAAYAHTLPMPHAEIDEATDMFLGIIGNIGVAVCPLDEDKLVGFLDDVVFIFEQDDVAVSLDDPRQL